MIIKDEAHATFGAFCSSPWEPHPTFFGTGESFVFTVRPEFGVYRWQPGLNQHFMLCRFVSAPPLMDPKTETVDLTQGPLK
jgi:hypothetical protein